MILSLTYFHLQAKLENVNAKPHSNYFTTCCDLKVLSRAAYLHKLYADDKRFGYSPPPSSCLLSFQEAQEIIIRRTKPDVGQRIHKVLIAAEYGNVKLNIAELSTAGEVSLPSLLAT